MTTTELIEQAFNEDLPDKDLTTDNLLAKEKIGYAFLVAKDDIVLSGQELFEKSILHLAPQSHIKWYFKDGDTVLKTQKIASIYGNLLQVIKAERVALNFLGFLSGIATTTHQFTRARHSQHLQILDTRKTLPLYRTWIKKAVTDGGGTNHRMNLSDRVLIKENHIRIAGSITKAVEQIRRHYNGFMEVEVTNISELHEALQSGAQGILLDNMSFEQIREALEHIPEGVFVEASGNMTKERVAQLSELQRLNAISVGAITHSAPTADLSLLFDF